MIAKYSFLYQFLVDFEKFSINVGKFWVSNERKTMSRAAKDLQWGSQFDVPGLMTQKLNLKRADINSFQKELIKKDSTVLIIF